MNSIIVIGTEPSCPRCQLLKNIIKSKLVELEIDAAYTHMAYTTEESVAVAAKHGLRPGTAKTVAEIVHAEVDSEEFTSLQSNYTPDPNSFYDCYNDCSWSIQMDELLRPLELQAKKAGIMMTPVLIINGEIVHQGSVPEIGLIDQWLLALK